MPQDRALPDVDTCLRRSELRTQRDVHRCIPEPAGVDYASRRVCLLARDRRYRPRRTNYAVVATASKIM